MSEEEQEKLYDLLFKDTKNKLEETIEELKEKNASLQKEIKLMKSININDNYISKDKINNLLNEYANTDLEDFGRIIEFYQKLKELLEE